MGKSFVSFEEVFYFTGYKDPVSAANEINMKNNWEEDIDLSENQIEDQ